MTNDATAAVTAAAAASKDDIRHESAAEAKHQRASSLDNSLLSNVS